jgi:hypothetical protein
MPFEISQIVANRLDGGASGFPQGNFRLRRPSAQPSQKRRPGGRKKELTSRAI